MGEASMRKWMRRAYAARPGVTADDIPGWRRWILRVWRSPRLRQAMRRKGLPLYHVALRMRREHRAGRILLRLFGTPDPLEILTRAAVTGFFHA